MRRIAVVNQKGGCGKTTTAVSLALCLQDMSNRVLLVDMDPQGSSTQSLHPETDSLEHTVYDLLMDSNQLPVSNVTVKAARNLDLLPASVVLSTVEQRLAGRDGREQKLRRVIDRVSGEYDFVIIDSPPNIGLLTFNALLAAKEIIIPVDPSLFSLQGVGRVIDALEIVRNVSGHTADFRVLATMYDSRTRISREILSTLKRRFGDSCFRTVIRSNVTLKEATGFGVPITHYRGSRGFYDYRSVANELLGNEPTQKDIEVQATIDFLAPRRIGGGVLFSYLGSEADVIAVEGSFNSWDASSDILLDVDGRGLWQRVIPLRPGSYTYRLVVDGNPIVDPNNPETQHVEDKGQVSVINL
ncbi:MAG: AAA family ATPase [bacterium]|jgi:chromosome partitioning protein